MLKFTFKWLLKHIEFKEKNTLKILEQIYNIFNEKSIEVEYIKPINAFLKIKVNSVTSKENMKVKICSATLNSFTANIFQYKNNSIQVLCGANNVKENMYTVLAPLGTTLPNGLTIAPRKIKEVLSEGMFCAYDEIGQEKISEGIIELNDQEEDFYSYEDIIICISTPTNRWDLMNVRGLARELSYAGLGNLLNLPLKIGTEEFMAKVSSQISIPFSFVQIENYSINTEIKNYLKNIEKLSNSDLQNLFDYILIDIGYPIHIYDQKNFKNIELIYNESAEEYTTLTSEIYKSQKNDILIKNTENNQVISIGGIAGLYGYNKDTENIIIEAGYISKNIINSVLTSSAKMFALGVDLNLPVLAYINSYLNGNISKIFMAPGEIHNNKQIFLSYADFYNLSGLALNLNEIKNNLEKYGFICEIVTKTKEEDLNQEFGLNITIPSWRSDIEITVDIIEEILRIYGVNNLHVQKDDIIANCCAHINFLDNCRDLLFLENFSEIYNFPFASSGDILIVNNMNNNYPYLRNSLLESLLINAQENFCENNNIKSIKLYEIGKIYPSEELKLGILFSGKILPGEAEFTLKHFKNLLNKLSYYLDINLNNILNEEENYLSFSGGFIQNLSFDKKYDRILNGFYAEITCRSRDSKFNILNTYKDYEDCCLVLDGSIQWSHIRTFFPEDSMLFDIFHKDNRANYNVRIFNKDINVEKLKDKIYKNFKKSEV